MYIKTKYILAERNKLLKKIQLILWFLATEIYKEEETIIQQ